MSVAGGVTPSVLETLEFAAALERVAAHAAGPLGAARVRARTPSADPDAVRSALAQVAELAARLLADDAIRAEPVPDIGPALDLLAVPGSALEGPALTEIGRALAAARIVATELARLAPAAPRTAALRVDPPRREIEKRLGESLDSEGEVLDSASRALARARQAVRETRGRARPGRRGHRPRRPLRHPRAQHRPVPGGRHRARRVGHAVHRVRRAP